MNIWLKQHIHAIKQALSQFRRFPAHFIFNIIVLAMTLILPIGGLTLLENLQRITGGLSVSPEISVFIKQEVSQQNAQALKEKLSAIAERNNQSAEIIFVSKDDALLSIQEKNELDDIAESLGENPLPDSYIIRLSAGLASNITEDIDALSLQYQNLPEIESVRVDSDWTKRLAAMMRVLRMALVFIAVTLGIIVVFVTFNTIRLHVLMHLDEIQICWRIGATRSYIRRPFYYMGLFLGLFSGTFALILVTIILIPFNSVLLDLSQLYGSSFQLSNLSPFSCFFALLFSAFLGWIGAILSVNRQLQKID